MQITHDAVLRALPSDVKPDLLARSDRKGLTHLLLYTGAIAVTLSWVFLCLPGWPIAYAVLGLFLVFLFTLQHECTHKTPFRSPWLNEVLGHICALILLQPFLWFRYYHLAHHRHTNDPDKDPELAGGGKPDTWHTWIWSISGAPFWIGGIRTLLQNAFGTLDAPYLPARAHRRIRWEARALLLSYLVIFTMAPLPALTYWIGPMVIAAPALRLYLLAEHGRCPHVANMLENTRTTFTTRLMRFLAWNMPYHIEHHSLPNVPFHALPALHDHMKPHLVSTSNGYIAFNADFVKSLGD